MTTTLGSKIRAARETAELSQADLARMIECDSQQVSKWERDINVPTVPRLAAIAVALNLEYDELFGNEQSAA